MAVVGSAIGGVSNGVEMVSARTAIQQYTAGQWMAMVMSLNEAVAQATPGLGFLLGGVITALANARVALAVAAAGSLAFTAVAWAALSPSRLPAPARGQDGPPPGEPPPGGPNPAPAGRETLV